MSIPSPYNKSFASVDVMIPNKHLIYSILGNKNVCLHDCESNKIIHTHQCHSQVLKVVTLNEQAVAAANQKHLSFIDIRNNANTYNYKINKDIKTITPLNQHTVFYGCVDGQVGVVDRRSSAPHWRNTTNHKNKIYDICRLNDMVVTGDATGQIVSWVSKEPHQ